MLPLLVCAATFLALASAYSIPDPEFQVLKPSGLKVSIPNEDGIEAFSFHGNVNQEMKGLESGQISQDASDIQNGKFTIYDENVNLQDGDVINYWLYIVYKGLGYHLGNGKFVYQESNVKNRECPPGYKKKALAAPQIDEITTWSSSDFDEITGSDGLSNYHRNYQHGFRPNIYYGRPWYPFYRRGHWHHFNGPRRGRGHNSWHRRNHNYRYNQFDLNDAQILQGGIGIPETEPILTIVKRHADSEEEQVEEEEDKSESSDVQLESRFGGGYSRGFGGANFINPRKPTHKPYRSHGYRFYGHGYDHRRDYDHGYGFYPGHHRPYGPPHRPYPIGPHPGFGKDHNKFDDYYDCEEDDSNEKPSEPANLETTTPPAKAPEVPSTEGPPITSPTTSTTTSTTTTTTTTERTSTFPQIDIRFGER